MELTIYQQLLELGMKKEELSSYCSDLYVKKNAISDEFVKNYEFKNSVRTFKSQIDGKVWYDIPLAYSEYFNKRIRYKK